HQQGGVEHYRRSLDLSTATAETSYRQGDITYRREYLTSFNGDVGVIRFSADTKAALTFSVTMARDKNAQLRLVGDELQLFGALDDGLGGTGMRYLARVRIQHTG